MTEKKTFKNPKITSYLDFIWVGWGEPYALDQGTTQFQKDEWDWEVTFTKKVEPIQINHLVQDADRYIGRVVAVQQDKAWVHYTTNQHGGIENFDGIEFVANLKRVG